jgi:hypothetical protein
MSSSEGDTISSDKVERALEDDSCSFVFLWRFWGNGGVIDSQEIVTKLFKVETGDGIKTIRTRIGHGVKPLHTTDPSFPLDLCNEL